MAQISNRLFNRPISKYFGIGTPKNTHILPNHLHHMPGQKQRKAQSNRAVPGVMAFAFVQFPHILHFPAPNPRIPPPHPLRQFRHRLHSVDPFWSEFIYFYIFLLDHRKNDFIEEFFGRCHLLRPIRRIQCWPIQSRAQLCLQQIQQSTLPIQ